jgi:hypothetical protein
MRHVLVHDYANIVSETLYDTAVNDIPVLRRQVAQYLAETDWQVWESIPDDLDPDEDLVNIARRMKAKDFSAEDVAEITGLTAEEIEAL